MTTYVPPYKTLAEDNNIRGASTLADYANRGPALTENTAPVTAANKVNC